MKLRETALACQCSQSRSQKGRKKHKSVLVPAPLSHVSRIQVSLLAFFQLLSSIRPQLPQKTYSERAENAFWKSEHVQAREQLPVLHALEKTEHRLHTGGGVKVRILLGISGNGHRCLIGAGAPCVSQSLLLEC